MESVATSCVVIGIGNEFRGDDAVGLYVARELAIRSLPDCTIKEAVGEGTYLMDCWNGYKSVVIIDAVRSSSGPGTIHRIDARTEALPANWINRSSHTVSLSEAIELSKTLGTLPGSVTIFGIEGCCFDAGRRIDSRVQRAADHLIDIIAGEISATRRQSADSV